MAKFFDTSYGNDECPSEGTVTRDKLYRIFYCEDVTDQPKYTIWSVARGDLSKEDANDAVFDFSDEWVDELETDSDEEFEVARRRIASLEGLRSLGSAGRTRRLRRGPRPSMTEVTELELFADNTEPLYRRRLGIEAMLVRKLAAGKYDRKKAVKAYRHYADVAAKMYLREFVWGRGQAPRGRGSYGIFSVKEREALAKREERQFFARVKSRDSELLDMVPKKYRKKGQSCEVRRINGTFKLDCNIDLRGLSSRKRRR